MLPRPRTICGPLQAPDSRSLSVLVVKVPGLDKVRIHDLRHSFASRALALDESLLMIGKLLGYTQVQTTAR